MGASTVLRPWGLRTLVIVEAYTWARLVLTPDGSSRRDGAGRARPHLGPAVENARLEWPLRRVGRDLLARQLARRPGLDLPVAMGVLAGSARSARRASRGGCSPASSRSGANCPDARDPVGGSRGVPGRDRGGSSCRAPTPSRPRSSRTSMSSGRRRSATWCRSSGVHGCRRRLSTIDPPATAGTRWTPSEVRGQACGPAARSRSPRPGLQRSRSWARSARAR